MRRLLFWVAVLAFLAFAIFDDPVKLARETYADIQCRMNETCYTALPMILPGVRVLFVDESLATREGRRVAILADAWPFCDDATGNVYRVPKFFETDFASIPGWAQF